MNKKIFLLKSNNKKISENQCFLFLKKNINNNNVYISGGKSLLGIYRKINKNKNLLKKNRFYLTDERLSQKKKNTNYFTITRKLNNKFFYKFNYLNYIKKKNYKLLIKKCLCLIPRYKIISVLGVGEDGHIGSILPGKFYKKEKLHIVKKIGEKFKRVTISEIEILKSNFIVFFISSKKKSLIIKKMIKGDENIKTPFFRICKNFKRKIYIFYY